MIKFDLVPFFWCVATVAFFTVTAIVDIMDLMAAYTGVRSILVLLVEMTGRARCILVCSFEGEVRFFIMIKCILLPHICGVAITAFFPLLTIMGV